MQNSTMEAALAGYADKKTAVFITLSDGSVVEGRVKSFDGYVILLDGAPGQMLYRHSILKLSDAPDTQKEAPPVRRPERREPAAPRTRPAERQRPAQRKPLPEQKPEPGQMGTLGEEILKWLKNQKGDG